MVFGNIHIELNLEWQYSIDFIYNKFYIAFCGCGCYNKSRSLAYKHQSPHYAVSEGISNGVVICHFFVLSLRLLNQYVKYTTMQPLMLGAAILTIKSSI